MIAFASDSYAVPLPAGHPFPMPKYAAVREALLTEGTLRTADVRDPGLASRLELEAAHDPAWVEAILTHTVGPEMERRIGLPLGPALERRARAAAAGTLGAARAALTEGVAVHLAGGTHHAGRARGAGFCLVNDIAIAASVLLREGAVRRVAVVDLDVHQGDGTHEIFADVKEVFTFSMHGACNFPRVKIPGRRDVALVDGTQDGAFLEALASELPAILDSFAPDLVLYQAGVDPLAGDRFGRLALTEAGLRARDRLVFSACSSRRIPVAAVLGGGYAREIGRTVAAHVNTVREAGAAWRGFQWRLLPVGPYG